MLHKYQSLDEDKKLHVQYPLAFNQSIRPVGTGERTNPKQEKNKNKKQTWLTNQNMLFTVSYSSRIHPISHQAGKNLVFITYVYAWHGLREQGIQIIIFVSRLRFLSHSWSRKIGY
jgi:hypothetical protein